jgi:hypothetical protein
MMSTEFDAAAARCDAVTDKRPVLEGADHVWPLFANLLIHVRMRFYAFVHGWC